MIMLVGCAICFLGTKGDLSNGPSFLVLQDGKIFVAAGTIYLKINQTIFFRVLENHHFYSYSNKKKIKS